jgi:hypothetical protein
LILNDIETKLKEIDSRVYYGIVDDEVRKTLWNYIVFNRTRFKSTGNKTGYADGYDVHIVRENFVPEGVDLEVIEKMQEINGLKLANEDGDYNYIRKPNTNIVVEMLTLHFVRARK